jgi:rod shape-determining protein MreC
MSRTRVQTWLPVLLVLVALIGIVLDRSGLLSPIEGAVTRATAPFQEAASRLYTRLGGLARTARDLRDLRSRNEQLEAENARLLLENVRYRELQNEVALLRDLVNLARANPTFELVGAHVVGKVIALDPSNLQRTITLDVGREVGIGRNMPVVTDRGLVGRISEVGTGWSRVLLITDMSSIVNSMASSTRANGLVQGQVDGSLLMRGVPQGDTLSVGDTVFTSGLGGNFPRQILIGQITEVGQRDYDLYQSAVVKPTVDFDHLELVLVITDFPSVAPSGGEAEDGEAK